MTPEAQRIAIAEACGWVRQHEYGGRFYKCPQTGTLKHDTELPDYPADLNAMHEADKVLSAEQQSQYAMTLHEMHGIPLATFWHRVICSTAAQRAEAFLRTIGKWEDDK